MNTKRKIASIMLYVVAGVALLFGFIYSFSPTLLPYHERALGMSHEQLQPEVAALFLTMMRVIGVSFLSIGAVTEMAVLIRFWSPWNPQLSFHLNMALGLMPYTKRLYSY